MAEQQRSTDRDLVAPRQRVEIPGSIAAAPASFWLASLASLGLIIGGIAPWATEFGFVSLSGTSMHGWRAVMVGVLGLAMLAAHQLRGARLPLVVAGVGGALAAWLAVAALSKINSDGAVSVFGQQYRFLDAAWGLYLVLAAGIALACATSALMWRASRAAR
jgi:hypothetical protein